MSLLKSVSNRIPVIALGASFAILQACSGGNGNGGGGGIVDVAVDDTASVNEGETVVIQVLSNDNNATSAALVSPPQSGNAVLNADNTFSYTHDSSDTTTDSFTYSASNSSGSSNATVTINIDNQLPAAVNECLPTRGNLNGTLDVLDPDDPASSLTFSIDPNDDGSKGTAEIVDSATGAFFYTLRDPNTFGLGEIRRGRDTFTYTVDDGQETATLTQTVIIDPKIMPLGDSITEGVESSNPDLEPLEPVRVGYRAELRQLLADGNFRTDFVGMRDYGVDSPDLDDPDNEGHGGFTIDNITNGGISEVPLDMYPGIADALDASGPDVILLHIGTNQTNQMGSDETALVALLDAINSWEQTSNQPVAVLLARIIPSGDEAANMQVNTFNQMLDGVAANRTQGNSNDLLLVVNQNGAVAVGDLDDDTIHPTRAGYDKMAPAWLNGLKGMGVGTLNTATRDFLEEVVARCP